MKVYQIIAEADFNVVKGSGGFNIVGPNGNVVGTEKIPGQARAQAEKLNAASKNAPLKATKQGLQLRLKDGTVLSNKSPSELLKELETKKVPGAKDILKKTKGWRARASRLYKILMRSTLLKLSLVGQGVAIMTTYFQDVEAFKSLWAATYPEGHTLALGSPFYQVAADQTLKPLQYSAIAAAATVMSLEMSRIIKAGKIRKITRALHIATLPLLGIPVIGWVAKAVMFAITEGAIWAAGWTIQKYGPDLFHYILNNQVDDVMEDLKGIVVTPPPPAKADQNEIKNKIKSELKKQQDGTIPKPPGAPKPRDPKNDGSGVDYDSIVLPN